MEGKRSLVRLKVLISCGLTCLSVEHVVCCVSRLRLSRLIHVSGMS